MSPELEEKLFNIGKLVYRNADNIHKSLLPYGFECSDGWFNILKDMTEELETYCSTLVDLETIEDYPAIVQVKEKFGYLTVYTHGYDENFSAIIKKYQNLSKGICEYCGNEADGITHGWMKTLCVDCAIANEKTFKRYFK